MADDERLTEKAKYERIWADPGYRRNSPGLNVAPFAFDVLGLMPGDSLIDYGCGEGKAVDYFRRREIKAKGVDIVKLRPDVTEACLWDMPKMQADYAFSADVLEHLPEHRVPEVLQAIRDRTKREGFFTIATCDDVHGDRIGETLHLTVQPIEWWREVLGGIFTDVAIGQGDREWRYWAHVTV